MAKDAQSPGRFEPNMDHRSGVLGIGHLEVRYPEGVRVSRHPLWWPGALCSGFWKWSSGRCTRKDSATKNLGAIWYNDLSRVC